MNFKIMLVINKIIFRLIKMFEKNSYGIIRLINIQ